MNQMNLTDKFLESIEKIAKKEVPVTALLYAKRALLDYIGVTIAGAKANNVQLEKYFKNINPESGNSTLIGMDNKTNLKEAIFLNGLNAHALDLDDGTNTGIIHLGSPIFSVLLPLAEKHNISIGEMLKAAIIGYETSFTMAVSIQPKHKAMGYHATGTCGVLGIAMAVSYMLNFDFAERRNSFAIAAVSSTGMLKVLDDQSELKPYNVAKSALLGLVATQMSQAGFIGNQDVLGGSRGFIKMMTGLKEIEFQKPILNGTYAVEKTYTKPYAACRYVHPAIEAAIKLKESVDIKEINKITVSTYDLAVSGHDHTDIKGISSAKMSIPYGVAVSLIKGKAGLVEYNEEHIRDESILELAKLVYIRADDEFSSVFPQKQIAIVEIKLKNGDVIREKVDFPRGEPENPLSNEEFTNRFIDLLKYAGYSDDVGHKIIEICNDKNNLVADLCNNL